jgi:hypothetical protein
VGIFQTLAELHAASLILEHTDQERFFELRKNVVEILFTDTETPGIGKFVNDLPNFTILCLKAAATPEDNNLKEIAFMDEHRGKIYDVVKVLLTHASELNFIIFRIIQNIRNIIFKPMRRYRNLLLRYKVKVFIFTYFKTGNC